MDYQIKHPQNINEISAVLSMLEKCFPKLKRKYFIKKILGDPAHDKSLTYLLVKDDSFVSHVQLFKKNIYCHGKKLPIIGLGEICTLPEYSNKGYCTKLLNRVIQNIKNKQAPIAILFTRRPHIYERLKFSKIIRKCYLLKRKEDKPNVFLKSKGLRVRRFNFDKDISSIMEIYKDFFKWHFGPVVRDLNYWQFQLTYFDEDKKLFLVLEDKSKIRAYIRCKRFKRSNRQIIDIVEFASKDKDSSFLILFLKHLFKFSGADYLRIDKWFIKENLSVFFEVMTEDSIFLMYRFLIKNKMIDRLKMREMIFLESDAF